MPEKMSNDYADLEALCASTTLAHVAYTGDSGPLIFPTAFALLDGQLVIHGSTGSRWMRHLEGAKASVAITRVTGLVVARSTFESSVHYRSAVIFGSFTRADSERHEDLLTRLSERLIPGRTSETRASLRKELAATMLLEMPLDHWSLRVSEGWPEDEDEDIAGEAWAGVIHLGDPVATAEAAPDLRVGIPEPESVRALVQSPRGIV
ncbi:pyridoxamine 5'-phosphate oxidase family protein [Leucobacter coleopterorum]|uniref:Pyridoxamine 5'-phosphate oxidase family protein n=2 Tax=Leucobacter coleopterorum TaxID=2714933 RepID=A0ABX6JZT7_9MICO|nr:pyridoxamine 5'-phosphate oxidase family protein [Leucobacter coleopterorum]